MGKEQSLAVGRISHESKRLSWWQTLLLLPFILVVLVLNGRIDGRWIHIGFSLLILVMGIFEADLRKGAFIYFCVGLFNFFSYWLIERVEGAKSK